MRELTHLLLDLDGTLLGLDIDRFVPVYLERLSAFVGAAVDLPDFNERFLGAVRELLTPRSDGRTNEQTFYDAFRRGLDPGRAAACDRVFTEFYRDVFPGLKDHTRPIPGARRFVAAARAHGYTLVLATSPVFPLFVIEERLRWAGVSPQAFALITSFEVTRHIKPDPRYFQDVLQTLGITAEAALMIGNDLRDDGAATQVGLRFAWIEGIYSRRRDPVGRPVWRGSMLALCRAMEGGGPPFVD